MAQRYDGRLALLSVTLGALAPGVRAAPVNPPFPLIIVVNMGGDPAVGPCPTACPLRAAIA